MTTIRPSLYTLPPEVVGIISRHIECPFDYARMQAATRDNAVWQTEMDRGLRNLGWYDSRTYSFLEDMVLTPELVDEINTRLASVPGRTIRREFRNAVKTGDHNRVYDMLSIDSHCDKGLVPLAERLMGQSHSLEVLRTLMDHLSVRDPGDDFNVINPLRDMRKRNRPDLVYPYIKYMTPNSYDAVLFELVEWVPDGYTKDMLITCITNGSSHRLGNSLNIDLFPGPIQPGVLITLVWSMHP